MNTQISTRPNWRIDLAAFIAVLVVAIIMISGGRWDPGAVTAVGNAVAAYCTWRLTVARRETRWPRRHRPTR